MFTKSAMSRSHLEGVKPLVGSGSVVAGGMFDYVLFGLLLA